MTLSHAETGYHHQPREEWVDPTGAHNSAMFSRIEIGAPITFVRQDNQSGFRRAVDYFAEEGGVVQPYDERHPDVPEPVLMIASPRGTIELYDGRKGGRHWYDLVRREDGKYRVTASGFMDKDTQVVAREGEIVFVGVVAGDATKDIDPTVEPCRKLFADTQDAISRARYGGLGRILQFFGV
jgi:hypothetical protein